MEVEKQSEEIISLMHSDLDENSEQFLSFFLGEEEYAVDILRVQEIKCWDSATEVPNSPSYLKGVINLRGTIVPIVDLRLRFGLEAIEYNETTVVIVLKVAGGENQRTVGFVVDAVSEVYAVEKELLKELPDLGGSIDTAYIKGVTTINEKMVILLEIDNLLDAPSVTESEEIH